MAVFGAPQMVDPQMVKTFGWGASVTPPIAMLGQAGLAMIAADVVARRPIASALAAVGLSFCLYFLAGQAFVSVPLLTVLAAILFPCIMLMFPVAPGRMAEWSPRVRMVIKLIGVVLTAVVLFELFRGLANFHLDA
jgi:hypothetical protein